MKGYKTILWNVGNALIPAMDVANSTYKIPEEWLPIWIAVYIAGNIFLRFVTTTPVGSK